MPAQETKRAAHSLGTPGAGSALDPHRNGMSHGSSPVQRLYRVRPKEGAGSGLQGGPMGGGALFQSALQKSRSGAGGAGPQAGCPRTRSFRSGPGAWPFQGVAGLVSAAALQLGL